MSLNDCLASAVAQKEITETEAQDLAKQFDEHLAASAGDAALAKARLVEFLQRQSAEFQRRADLTEAARLNLKTRFMAEKDFFSGAKAVLSHYGFRNGSSVRGRTEAILALAHSQLSDAMFAFRRSGVMGKRENMALLPDVVKELHGEQSGDATAKALAESISDVMEDLRLRFNAAGGAMPKLEGFGLPHSHDRLKVKALGRDGWKGRMRQAVDPSRMTDSMTQMPITPEALERALDHAYDQIVSDSTAHLTPTMTRKGLGAISERRGEQRFFVYRDAASWMAYHRDLGKGDVVQAMFGHINTMAKDIAAMELLGPNPAAMVEWMKQVVAREFGQKAAGKPNKAGDVPIFEGHSSEGSWAVSNIEWLWQTLRGTGSVVSGGGRPTYNPIKVVVRAALNPETTGSIKNIVSSALLGKTGIQALLVDPVYARLARKAAGLPMMGVMRNMIKMTSQESRDQIVRSGVIWDEYVHVVGDDLRTGASVFGAEWTKWIADRAMMANGLKPLTTGRKLVEARAWQGHIADLAKEGRAFDDLAPVFRRALDGFGITEGHWNIWTTAIDRNGFVTPHEIVKRGGSVTHIDMANPVWGDSVKLDEAKALAHREAAEKLAELTTSWSERSVPTGTVNTKAVVSGSMQRGTILGELAEHFMTFKGFGLSATALQLETMAEMGNGRRLSVGGLGYLANLVVPATILTGGYIWIGNLLDGKDLEELDAAFAAKALLQSGGLGVFGDFIKSTENRFGQSQIEALAGPSIAFLGDAGNLVYQIAADAAGLVRKDNEGVKSTAIEARQMLQKWTPIVSSHPATRAAYNRVVLDNLQYYTDPDAYTKFKRKIAKAKKDGSPYFLPPGTLTPASRKLPPRRAPNVGNAVGQ
jgi:hypothetical protein